MIEASGMQRRLTWGLGALIDGRFTSLFLGGALFAVFRVALYFLLRRPGNQSSGSRNKVSEEKRRQYYGTDRGDAWSTAAGDLLPTVSTQRIIDI